MRSALGRVGNTELTELYNSWMVTNDLRDHAMMENIRKYCAETSFDRGVFLVGASHRRSIINKAKKQSAADAARVLWDVYGCGTRANPE
jgi:hypothetical protein